MFNCLSDARYKWCSSIVPIAAMTRPPVGGTWTGCEDERGSYTSQYQTRRKNGRRGARFPALQGAGRGAPRTRSLGESTIAPRLATTSLRVLSRRPDAQIFGIQIASLGGAPSAMRRGGSRAATQAAM